MDYDFFNSLSPKMLDVVKRDPVFWQSSNYRIVREKTLMHIFGFVVEGEGSIRLEGHAQQELRQGTVFQVWPGNHMEIITSPEKPLCFYSVHYQYGLLQWDGIKAYWQVAEGPLPMGNVLPGIGNQSMEDDFKQIFEIWHEKEAGFEWETRVGFLNLIKEVTAATARRRSAEESGAASLIREAIDFMKMRYEEDLTRETMAKRASLSPSYFSSLFKKHTGYSPIQYLTRIRLDKAKQLLKESRMPIKQVAEEVGFVDSFYFTRLFTRETGLTPSQYRHA